MTTTKKITDSSVASVATIPDTALVAIFDPTTGNASKSTFAALKQAVRMSAVIEGRNLIKGSAVYKNSADYPMANYQWGEDKPTVGDTLTVTIWGKLGEGKNNFAVYGHTGTTEGCAMLREVAPGIYQGKCKILQPWNYVRVFPMPSSVTDKSTINRIKVERGEIADEWTPAPEDQNWGGVIYCLSAVCYSTALLTVSAEKGGRHD